MQLHLYKIHDVRDNIFIVKADLLFCGSCDKYQWINAGSEGNDI